MFWKKAAPQPALERFVAGESYRRGDVLKGRGSAPRLAGAGVELYGDALLLPGPDAGADGARFCISRVLEVEGGAASLTTSIHGHWTLRDVEPPEELVGLGVHVFRTAGEELESLGHGHIGSCRSTSAEGSGRQVFSGRRRGRARAEEVELLLYFDEASPELAQRLETAHHGEPLDGAELTGRLDSGPDLLTVAEELAESWLGPLPTAPAPAASASAPPDVRRWHALWARLAAVEHLPFRCWPAAWGPSETPGTTYLQSEWQNGGTFGVRDAGVWIDAWAMSDGEDTLAAQSVGEFALQFLIYGLTEGSNGRFLASTAHWPELVELPLGRWDGFLSCSTMCFVGGRGLLGIRYEDGDRLCVGPERFDELCAGD